MTLTVKKTTSDDGFRIIGKPSANKAEGYISFRDTQNVVRLHRPSEFSDLRFGDALTEQLMFEFGLRAQGINGRFKVDGKKFFINAPSHSLLRAFHAASQGYSVDLAPIMTDIDLKRPLPLPYPLYEDVEGKGIYIGLIEPNYNLGQIFNVFAAPEDLPHSDGSYEFKSEEDMQQALERLKNWHGHDGLRINRDDKITADNAAQREQWHLPYIAMDTYNERHLRPGPINLLQQVTPESENRFYFQGTHYDGNISCYSTGDRKSSYQHNTKPYRVRPIRLEPYHMPANA